MSFKVGQKVVCVDPRNSDLKKGKQYTVREVRDIASYRNRSDEPERICVVECSSPHFGFRPSRFKAAEPYVEPSGYTEELME